jgi:hypothetical protein
MTICRRLVQKWRGACRRMAALTEEMTKWTIQAGLCHRSRRPRRAVGRAPLGWMADGARYARLLPVTRPGA